MTDEPTNEWAEELNERYLRQEKKLMKAKLTNKWEEEFDGKFSISGEIKKITPSKIQGTGYIDLIETKEIKDFIHALIAKERQAQREEIKGVVEGMKQKQWEIKYAFSGNSMRTKAKNNTYNQALDDILKRIT